MKAVWCLVVSLFLFFGFFQSAWAIEDPLVSPNNKIGIHILFPSELGDAARLVNSNGGDWGYVTIPIQAGDRDLDKWQSFMDECRNRHIIPIVRLATEGDYFNTTVWRKPNYADIVDFANFLNSLAWPTKNRYIIVFNEVNRGDEWGGLPNPEEYAQLLSFSVTVFKSKSQNFFMIGSGMDNASANTAIAMDEYTYFTQMDKKVPGIFNQIDGLSSHSYPNPAFSQPPDQFTPESVGSFHFEQAHIRRLSLKTLPVFITETGWSSTQVPDEIIGTYFAQALSTLWSDPSIVAVTPFLLRANGQFTNFSFLDDNGNPNSNYKIIFNMRKTKGKPVLSASVLSATLLDSSGDVPIEHFSRQDNTQSVLTPSSFAKLFRWLLKVD